VLIRLYKYMRNGDAAAGYAYIYIPVEVYWNAEYIYVLSCIDFV